MLRLCHLLPWRIQCWKEKISITFVFSSTSPHPKIKLFSFLRLPFNCGSFISNLESILLSLSTVNPVATQCSVVSERALAVRGRALWAQEEQPGRTHTPVMRTSGVAFPTAALSPSLSLYQHTHYKHTRSHRCTIKQAFVSHRLTTPTLHNNPITLLSTHLHARWSPTVSHPKKSEQHFSFFDCSALRKAHICMSLDKSHGDGISITSCTVCLQCT